MLQQLHLTELCSKCWVHTRVHTAALLRLIIGERETNSNAGSARVRLFFDLFDLIYLFVCFFPRIFRQWWKEIKSRVGKRQFVSHEWENSSRARASEKDGSLGRLTYVGVVVLSHSRYRPHQHAKARDWAASFFPFLFFLLPLFRPSRSLAPERPLLHVKSSRIRFNRYSNWAGDDESNRSVWFLWAILCSKVPFIRKSLIRRWERPTYSAFINRNKRRTDNE